MSIAAAIPTGRRMVSARAIALGLALAALALAPLAIYPLFLMKALCFALFAAAFNLLLGYAGILTIGHAAFFGMAAYTAGYALRNWGATPETGLLIGTATGAALWLAVAALAIRRQGIYLAMITLALAQMVHFFALQAPFTGGEDGLQSVPRGKALGLIALDSTPAIYGFVLITFLIGMAVIWRVVHSPFGQILKAIRANELRAVSLGYDVARYKLLAFVLSAALSGTAGALKVLVFCLASLTDVHWFTSGEVILMVLIGGVGTFLGPVVGAFVIIGLQSYLAGFGGWIMMIEGAVFILCVLLFRQGIVGWAGGVTKTVWARRRTAPAGGDGAPGSSIYLRMARDVARRFRSG